MDVFWLCSSLIALRVPRCCLKSFPRVQRADRLFLTDVYAASEEPIPGVTGRSMADAVRARGQEVEYLENLEDVSGVVAKNSRPGDIILFLGAGDITLEAHKYAALLDGAKGQG